VRTNADGTVTMTLRQLADPAALRRVLAAHGVPAIVYAGAAICQQADGDGPPGLDTVITHPRSGGDPRDKTVIVIRPAAIPRGSELLFNVTVNPDGVAGVGVGLIHADARIACQTPPPPSTAPSPVLTPPAKG
jgi:hypothetical protein